MYVSITKTKTKKGNKWKKHRKSAVKKNPVYVPPEPYTWTSTDHNGTTTHHAERDPYIKGDPFLRDTPKPHYIVKVGKSFRDKETGKPRSKQAHFKTFSEWDIVDDYIFQQLRGGGYTSHWIIDFYDFEKVVKKAFPGIEGEEMDKLWQSLNDKFDPIVNRVLNEFKESEEFKVFMENYTLQQRIDQYFKEKREEAREEKERKEKQNREYERKSRESSHEEYKRFSNGSGSNLSDTYTLSKEEAELLKECHRAMAMKLHPDKGGSDEKMKVFNRLMEKLKR